VITGNLLLLLLAKLEEFAIQEIIRATKKVYRIVKLRVTEDVTAIPAMVLAPEYWNKLLVTMVALLGCLIQHPTSTLHQFRVHHIIIKRNILSFLFHRYFRHWSRLNVNKSLNDIKCRSPPKINM
jgi:hypothetical protein